MPSPALPPRLELYPGCRFRAGAVVHEKGDLEMAGAMAAEARAGWVDAFNRYFNAAHFYVAAIELGNCSPKTHELAEECWSRLTALRRKHVEVARAAELA